MNNPIISIVSANVSSPEWAELLIKSIRKYSIIPHEIIIIDNDSVPETLKWFDEQDDVQLVKFALNLGHGGSMDIGTRMCRAKYVCFLDIDSHVQRLGWDKELIDLYNGNPRIRMIGTKGPEWHPFIAPLFFYERDFIVKNDIYFRHISAETTIDTAQRSYFQIKDMGYEIVRLERGAKVYKNASGDEIYLNNKPTFYHHWNGTRFNENNPKIRKSILEGVTIEEHLEGKKRLFAHRAVREILRG